MSTHIFQGELVRLTIFDPEKDAPLMKRWNQDSEFQQLQSSGPANLWSEQQIKDGVEKQADECYTFAIRTLEDDRVIGAIDLSAINWTAGNAWVGIGIGEREYWGRGYGADAMRLLLRFAFGSLNLRRISLGVFEYNQRAVQSYLKTGFREEGRLRQWMQRAGQRYDLIYMGILREEWTARLERGSGQDI